MMNHAAQMAIIKQLSRQELCSTAGNCQADEQTGITQLSRPWSPDSVGTVHLADHTLIT